MISVIHNILNEYKADKGYYTIMPTKKELQQEIEKLEKENQQLKREIYEIVGEEGIILGQTGFWNNDSNEVELKEWVEPIQN